MTDVYRLTKTDSQIAQYAKLRQFEQRSYRYLDTNHWVFCGGILPHLSATFRNIHCFKQTTWVRFRFRFRFISTVAVGLTIAISTLKYKLENVAINDALPLKAARRDVIVKVNFWGLSRFFDYRSRSVSSTEQWSHRSHRMPNATCVCVCVWVCETNNEIKAWNERITFPTQFRVIHASHVM